MDFMPKIPKPNTGPNLGIPVPALTHKTIHIKSWLCSQGYSRLLKFIQRLNVSIKNKRITDPCKVTENN
ncbi:hypothetical protein H8356DRAFT_1429489 [Neocallimastix lanati (nom. inval.)]|nr:hypothetical protein H8356DRAFT_1429489 [Neocallimastix sp. JGI-2020a]